MFAKNSAFGHFSLDSPTPSTPSTTSKGRSTPKGSTNSASPFQHQNGGSPSITSKASATTLDTWRKPNPLVKPENNQRTEEPLEWRRRDVQPFKTQTSPLKCQDGRPTFILPPKIGQIVWLPTPSSGSIFHGGYSRDLHGSQPFNHPQVVLQVDGSEVLLAGITSFSNDSFAAKNKSRGWAKRYHPIDHDGHEENPKLELLQGKLREGSKSYVNCELPFVVEWRECGEFTFNNTSSSPGARTNHIKQQQPRLTLQSWQRLVKHVKEWPGCLESEGSRVLREWLRCTRPWALNISVEQVGALY